MQEGGVEQESLQHALSLLARAVCEHGARSTGGPGEDRTRPPRLDGKVTENDEGVLGEAAGVFAEQQPDALHDVPALEVARPLGDLGNHLRIRVGDPGTHQRHAGRVRAAEDLQLTLQLGTPLLPEDVGVGDGVRLHQPGMDDQRGEEGPARNAPVTEGLGDQPVAVLVDPRPQGQCCHPGAQGSRQLQLWPGCGTTGRPVQLAGTRRRQVRTGHGPTFRPGSCTRNVGLVSHRGAQQTTSRAGVCPRL